MHFRKIFDDLWNFGKGAEVIKALPCHPTENFEDFAETHIEFENSEKIHGHLW